MNRKYFKSPPRDKQLPEDHPWHGQIVYDTKEQKWYNIHSDIYLSPEDAAAMQLPKPESLP